MYLDFLARRAWLLLLVLLLLFVAQPVPLEMCNDLKTGQIVGASPFRQQIMQIIGVGVASLVMAPIMQLLHENTPGGIGGRELAALRQVYLQALADGFFELDIYHGIW